MKRWIAVGVLAVAFAVGATADTPDLREYTLYGGSDTDSTEQASTWIDVRGANRVAIRLWSSHAAFTFTATDTANGGVAIVSGNKDADSTYSDSITVFRVAFTDSVTNFPMIAGDSVIVTASAVDTSIALIRVDHPPLNQQLRGPGNGSGIVTLVSPTLGGAASADANGVILKRYMRVYVTPLRRNTVSGGSSTAGKRVNGLKGLRGKALVLYR